jgi:hypothetical protein
MPDEPNAPYWKYDPPGKSRDSQGHGEAVVYYSYSKTKPPKWSALHGQRAEHFTYFSYRCLCQVDLGERADFALSSISLS